MWLTYIKQSSQYLRITRKGNWEKNFHLITFKHSKQKNQHFEDKK